MEDWNKYYVKNSEIIELINTWSSSTGKEKENIQSFILSKLSFLIYAKIKTYRREYFHEDLVQEGKIALIRAIEDFDVNRGTNFFTIASWYLSNHFKKFLKNNFKEIACENIEQFIKDCVKSPQDYYEKIEKEKLIKQAILSLPKMEKYVLVMRYGFFDSREYTLKEIGEMFSVSKQYVEQVEKKAVSRVQKKIYKELGETL